MKIVWNNNNKKSDWGHIFKHLKDFSVVEQKKRMQSLSSKKKPRKIIIKKTRNFCSFRVHIHIKQKETSSSICSTAHLD